MRRIVGGTANFFVFVWPAYQHMKDKTVSSSFLERLQRNTLTNADQYRAMKKSLAGSESTVNTQPSDTEEWKNWELTPVSSGSYSDVAKSGHSDGADAALLKRALEQLEK